MPGRILNYAGSLAFLRRFLDLTATSTTWHLGMVRDTARHLIPDGGLYDVADFFVHEPGKAWKRGGWGRQSLHLGSCSTVKAVATIHEPTKVFAVGDDGNLYEVTSENALQADVVGACYTPSENPPYFVNRLIFCDPTGANPPQKVYYNIHTHAVTIGVIGGTGVPNGSRSCSYLDRIVLANSGANPNRVWFSPTEIPIDASVSEGTWDTASWIDVNHPVTGLASVSGALLIFSVHQTMRISGGIPPHTPSDPTTDNGEGDMSLDVLAEVGCTDARSIVEFDENCIFAGTDGVYLINSAGIQSLTDHGDETGIQRYWREIFPIHTFDGVRQSRQLIGGLLNREFYILVVLDENGNNVVTLCCHVATRVWTRLSNVVGNMFATGSDEQNLPDLYMASATEGYVERLRPILSPSSTYANDGDGTAVIPMMELRPMSHASALGSPLRVALCAFGYGWVTYALSGSANLKVYDARNIVSNSYTLLATMVAGAMKRVRFTPFCDNNALSIRITQDAASNSTEIYGVELEVRSYAEQSDYA